MSARLATAFFHTPIGRWLYLIETGPTLQVGSLDLDLEEAGFADVARAVLAAVDVDEVEVWNEDKPVLTMRPIAAGAVEAAR